MFLKLAHTNLDAYKYSYDLTLEVYRLTKHLPESEKFNLISQLRRAALSVHLNLSEGSSRKSLAEKRRYYEIARGSVIEIDAAMDIIVGLAYISRESLSEVGAIIINTFKVLSGLIDKNNANPA